MTSDDLHWLSGLWEGEGSFFCSGNTRNGKTRYYLHAEISMTDEDVIARASEIIGMPYRTHWPPAKRDKGHQAQYRIRCMGNSAVVLGELLLPQLGSRRTAQYEAAKRKAEESNL